MNSELIERLHVGSNELYDKRADHMRPYAALMREAADALSAQDSAQDEIDLIAEARGPVEAMAAENMRAHLDSAQPVALPSSVRRQVERSIEDALNPKGMSTHSGMARVHVSFLQRMLAVIDSCAPASAPVCVWILGKWGPYPWTATCSEKQWGEEARDQFTCCPDCGGKIKWENSDV